MTFLDTQYTIYIFENIDKLFLHIVEKGILKVFNLIKL
jgi:hypothetical protein